MTGCHTKTTKNNSGLKHIENKNETGQQHNSRDVFNPHVT